MSEENLEQARRRAANAALWLERARQELKEVKVDDADLADLVRRTTREFKDAEMELDDLTEALEEAE